MNIYVENYGAKGDGVSIDTRALQASIDYCRECGGGKVVLSGGKTYRSGTLVLYSNVELHLEAGAVLKGSDHLEDYNVLGLQKEMPKRLTKPTYENCDFNGAPTLYFIYAHDQENVAITGLGKIDGNETIFYGPENKYHIDGYFYPRVPLLFLENIRHLTIQNVTLANSAFWTTHMIGCSDVLIDGIRILNNLRLANCDGIDPDHCKNVRISNCHIECADDCIVFKNTANFMQYGPCENITVENCTLTSTSAAIKFGTESEALFRNILISNCTISDSNRGISLQLRDKGSIENVIFSNITIGTRLFAKDEWWGCAEPVAITALKRNQATNVGHIKNILFQNIFCESENGILIYGDDSVNISDVAFKNVKLNLVKKTEREKGMHDLRPCEGNIILDGNLTGVFMKNARNVEFENVKISADEEMKKLLKDEFCLNDND